MNCYLGLPLKGSIECLKSMLFEATRFETRNCVSGLGLSMWKIGPGHIVTWRCPIDSFLVARSPRSFLTLHFKREIEPGVQLSHKFLVKKLCLLYATFRALSVARNLFSGSRHCHEKLRNDSTYSKFPKFTIVTTHVQLSSSLFDDLHLSVVEFKASLQQQMF